MPKKEFDRVLEVYLTEGFLRVEEWEEMDDLQKMIIQAIKRARNRLKNKN